MAKVAIGFITYGQATAKYLPFFLKSLMEQTVSEFKIYAVDNTEKEINENSDYLKNNFPKIDLEWAGENIGFARGYNRMINKAVKEGAEYFLALNPDMVLAQDMLEKLLAFIKIDVKVGAVQPKILKWDFVNNKKTDIIDSLGLKIDNKHRFFDEKQGQVDNKLFVDKEVFGFTGAAVLMRMEALKDTAFGREFFDELMFMYKEDCDLSYRLRLAGWKICLSAEAVCYHDRTAALIGENIWQIIKNRKNKSKNVKKWSFLNQWVIILKYKNLPYPFNIKTATWWYQFKSLFFILLFEQYLLGEFVKLNKIKSEISKKKEALKIRIGAQEIVKFMK